jgi:hypothetical protein
VFDINETLLDLGTTEPTFQRIFATSVICPSRGGTERLSSDVCRGGTRQILLEQIKMS